MRRSIPLLLLMVLAGGGSFGTRNPSSHMMTSLEMLRHFLDVTIRTEELSEDVWQVTIEGAGPLGPPCPKA